MTTMSPHVNSIVLRVGGDRTVVELAEATDIAQRWARALENATCHTLDVSGRAWRVQVLQVLEPLLERIALTVHTLKIDDITASLETSLGLATFEYIAQIFGGAPNLRRVNLDDNAIGQRGVERLLPLLKNVHVTDWSLENTGLGAEDGLVLCEALVETNDNDTMSCRLQALRTGRNRMGTEGAQHLGTLLSHCTELVVFAHAGASPLPPGAAALLQGLATMTTSCGPSGTRLQHLDLSDCTMSEPRALDHFCAILEHSPRLQVLCVRDSGLDATALQRVLEAVSASGAGLVTLDVGALESLGTTGGVVLRNFLSSSVATQWSLQHLMVDLNELANDGVAAVAAGAAQCRALQTLNLEDSEIERAGGLALLRNPIATLHTLCLEDNVDLPASIAAQLQRLYTSVKIDEDLGDDDNEEDEEDDDNDIEVDNHEEKDNDAVDDLVAGLQSTHL
jgi:Ran GTPase-activating protein (RanGAP) involved in mRNA processing and transport